MGFKEMGDKANPPESCGPHEGPKNTAALNRLGTLCRQWGGSLVVLPQKEISVLNQSPPYDWFGSPFAGNLGLHWEKKQVVYAQEHQPPFAFVLHEMGHVFADREDPNRSGNEVDFFGWEYMVAKSIRAPIGMWLEGNSNYVISDDNFEIGWFLMSPAVREKSLSKPKLTLRQILRNSVARSRALGLLDGDKPLTVR